MADDKNNPDDDSLEDSSTVVHPSEPDQDSTPNTPLNNSSALEQMSAKGNEPSPKKQPFFKRLLGIFNPYLIIFIVLLVMAAGVIYVTVKSNSKNNGNKTPTAQSLTDQQISDLKGNTTLVGDSQQTLDIQGNSIFEGSVLMRNSLDVAGSIKIGGTLSLPSISVGGSSSFGQIQVTQTLLVGGDTTMQGHLTVQKGLSVTGPASFAALSASQLNVSTLQLSGDLTISHHIDTSGGSPSRGGGSALGGGGTVSVNGSDTAGTVTINTGGGPPAGCFVTINFTQRFNSTPHVVISPSNSSAGTINYYANRSTSNFSICTASAPAPSTTYVFDYIAID